MADPIDVIPTGNDFYIVYTDPKKDSYVTAFLVGINKTGSPAVREAFTKYAAANINTFSTLVAFNSALVDVGQPRLAYDPYTQADPDTICNEDNDGNCT